MMKNNLFNYATSELSQDAFICYLMSFALEDAKDDPILRSCAKSVLAAMVPEIAEEQVVLTGVERQKNHIDVLLTAVCNEKKYKIVVEDKTYTSQHGNQLRDYLDYLRSTYPDYISKGVYYKTGFQSDLSPVTEAGYQIITRSRMLELLAPCAERTSNQIILDYFEYWNEFEQEAQAYRTTPLAQWGWRQIYGFYDTLKNSDFPDRKQVGMKYEHVVNRSGGFENLCIWLHDDIVIIHDVSCELYLQIEATWRDGKYDLPICLKLKPLGGTVSGKDIRNAIIYDGAWNYRLTHYHFKKPGRLAPGTHMTIGAYDATYETAESLRAALSSAIDDYMRLTFDLRSNALE